MIWTFCFSQAPNDFGCNGECSIDVVAEGSQLSEGSQLCFLFLDGVGGGGEEITQVGGEVGGQ